MHKLVASFVVAASTGILGAATYENYTIPAGTSETFKEETTITGELKVQGELTVPSGVTVTPGSVNLGGSASTYATVTVTGANASFGSNLDTAGPITVGAGGTLGKVLVREKGKLNSYRTVVAEGAATDPDTGYVDFLDIGPGEFWCSGFKNDSTKVGRVLFRGGYLQIGQRWHASLFVQNEDVKRFVFEGVDGNPIHIRSSGGPTYFYHVYTQGDCDMKIEAVTSIFNANLRLQHTGWTTISGGASMGANPWAYGDAFEKNAGVTITGGTQFTLARQAYSFRNLDATNGVLAVSSGTAPAVTMGRNDTSGFLRAAIPTGARLEKIGSGTTTIDAPSSAPSANVKAGTLKIAAPFTVGTLTLDKGTTLIVAGKLAYETLVDNGATIELMDGGEFVRTVADVAYLEGCRKSGGTLVKDGAGTLTVYDPQAFEGDLHVKAGTVDFSALGRAEKFWRFTFTEAAKNFDESGVCSVGDIILMRPTDPDEMEQGSDFLLNGYSDKSQGAGTLPKNLKEGFCAFQCTPMFKDGSQWYQQVADRLFDNSFNNNFPMLTGPVLVPGDPTTHYSIALRLKADADPVYAYDLIHPYNCNRPKSWYFEASDDGENWTVVDTRSNQSAINPDTSFSGFTKGANKAYKSFVLPLGYKRSGVRNMPAALGAQVDAGATLDFSCVTGGQGVNALVYDPALGAGTIRNMKVAGTGNFDIRGETAATGELGYTFEGLADAANFEKWTVTLNGKSTPRKLVFENGKLSLVAQGMVIWLK